MLRFNLSCFNKDGEIIETSSLHFTRELPDNNEVIAENIASVLLDCYTTKKHCGVAIQFRHNVSSDIWNLEKGIIVHHTNALLCNDDKVERCTQDTIKAPILKQLNTFLK